MYPASRSAARPIYCTRRVSRDDDLDVAETLPEDFDPHHWAGVVVMGGPMSVTQCCDLPFLQREIQWLRLALQHKTPDPGAVPWRATLGQGARRASRAEC